jgi:hypothetical protein
MATIDQYLSALAEYLYVSDNEYEMRVARFGALVERISQKLPETIEIRMFGSLTRRTGLSMRAYSNTDIDVLLALPQRSFRGKRESILEALRLSFEQDSAFTNVRVAFPGVSLDFHGTHYDVFPVLEVEGGGYVFVGPFGAWQDRVERAPKTKRFYYGLGSVTSEDPHKPSSRPGGTNPFLMNQHIGSSFDDVYSGGFHDRRYGGLHRGLVLLLKYWKLSTPVTSPGWVAEAPWSFILEENALRALDDSTRFKGCQGLFDFLHRFLSNTDLYDYALLSQISGFVEFKSAVQTLHAAGHAPDSDVALQSIGVIFPVPKPASGVDPAHRFEADRLRESKSTFV